MGLGIKDNCKRTVTHRRNIMMSFEYPWEKLQEESEHKGEAMGVKSEAFVLNRFFQGDSAALGEKWRRESLGIPQSQEIRKTV